MICKAIFLLQAFVGTFGFPPGGSLISTLSTQLQEACERASVPVTSPGGKKLINACSKTRMKIGRECWWGHGTWKITRRTINYSLEVIRKVQQRWVLAFRKEIKTHEVKIWMFFIRTGQSTFRHDSLRQSNKWTKLFYKKTVKSCELVWNHCILLAKDCDWLIHWRLISLPTAQGLTDSLKNKKKSKTEMIASVQKNKSTHEDKNEHFISTRQNNVHIFGIRCLLQSDKPI